MSSNVKGDRLPLTRRHFMLAAMSAGGAGALWPTQGRAQGFLGKLATDTIGELQDLKDDVLEEAAYLLGMEAYVYGFPLVMMDVTRGVLTATSQSGQYKAPINQFSRVRTYVDPDFKDIVRISVNSLWSFAAVDLGKEPMVYAQPDTQGRYIVMQALNMWTDDVASVGSRTIGTGAGNFLIAGPTWTGTAPSDVKATFRCPTRYALVWVQIACESPKEFADINTLQDQLQLMPLSAWGTPYTPPGNVPIDASVDITATPYDQVRLMTGEMFFNRLAMLLVDNPPYPADAPMIAKLKKLGVEPGKAFDGSTINPGIIKGLNRAPAEVWLKFQAAPLTLQAVNGWINFLSLGRFGTAYDIRALVAWGGVGALTSEDAVYPITYVDGDNRVLNGAKKYTMHFGKEEMPPSHSGVWSVSAYRENFYVRNAIERYGITSGMPLTYNADGSLDLSLQARSPGADKETNWLPIPPSGPFNVSLRAYWPTQALLDGTYKIPPLKQVS